MLNPGLYEQVVNEQISQEMKNLPENLKDTRDIDKAEAADILSSYLASVVRKGMENIQDSNEDGLQNQIELANQIISLVEKKTENPSYKDFSITPEAKELRAILDANIKRAKPEKNDVTLDRPDSPIRKSSIFTGGAVKEPKLFMELKKEINTADQIDFLVSFIKWSGLVKIIDELKDFTQRGKHLRVITTTYTGATDLKAIKELSALPNTEIKISYDTKRTRLHAKAYIFYRNTGFSVAYVGSSNLSNAATSSGLEWNFKVTETDLPDTMKKVTASFDTYWNSADFTLYTEGDEERLKNALKEERFYGSGGKPRSFVFDIQPYSYQQDILDDLEAERKIHGRYKNLVVAATGTGKTVISALDYRNYRRAHPQEKNKLLFVAHREEILRQSLDTFQWVLKDLNFGDLYVGNHKPESLEHLFVSIQTLNSQKLWEKLPADYYDFIIVDEFHHAAAESYKKLLNYFKPKILLGLTATPERMDGANILSWFDGHIAAEIRLPEAIDRKLLSPFQYFGVTDSVDLSQVRWVRGGYDVKELETLYVNNKNRVEYIIKQLDHYVTDIDKVKGLGFCVSKEHAKYMADMFEAYGIPSKSLTSESRDEERFSVKAQLVSGDIKFIFVVDLYNEGVDIPEVNTVMFLRPTESLTVFLQQLGRGLRLAENKECLTVLDFIGQANQHYNFEPKFRAITSDPPRTLRIQVKDGFTNVPSGCFIQLENRAAKYILESIKKNFNGKNAIAGRIKTFEEDTGLTLTLKNFLDYYKQDMDIRKIYRGEGCFSDLKVVAGVIPEFDEPAKPDFKTAFQRLISIDSRRWIDFLLDKFLPNLAEPFNPALYSPEELQMIQMFYISIWMKAIPTWDDVEALENLQNLAESPILLGEIKEVLNYKKEAINFVDEKVDFVFPDPCPLDLYCNYTRDQLLVALGVMNPATVREGVKWLPKKQTDLLFVTLNKSLHEYSPSTLYRDYSIDENTFHWESQSTTSEESETGKRYIHHQEWGNQVLLFVRECKKDEFGITGAYTFLGKVDYISHEGSCPMAIKWHMERPIPVKYLKKTNKLGLL